MTTTRPDGTPPELSSAIHADTGTSRASRRLRERKGRRVRRLIEWTVVIAVALLLAFVIKTWVMQAFFIPSGSMEPTLNIGDRILVNKLSYDLHPIHRGDIVVFGAPPQEPGYKDLVKRVVGLPGDTISSQGGHVYINGKPLAESYLPAGTMTCATGGGLSVGACANMVSLKIGPNQYFVMGDNRLNSSDSRVFGPIKGSLVVGRGFVRVWPLSRLGVL